MTLWALTESRVVFRALWQDSDNSPRAAGCSGVDAWVTGSETGKDCRHHLVQGDSSSHCAPEFLAELINSAGPHSRDSELTRLGWRGSAGMNGRSDRQESVLMPLQGILNGVGVKNHPSNPNPIFCGEKKKEDIQQQQKNKKQTNT